MMNRRFDEAILPNFYSLVSLLVVLLTSTGLTLTLHGTLRWVFLGFFLTVTFLTGCGVLIKAMKG